MINFFAGVASLSTLCWDAKRRQLPFCFPRGSGGLCFGTKTRIKALRQHAMVPVVLAICLRLAEGEGHHFGCCRCDEHGRGLCHKASCCEDENARGPGREAKRNMMKPSLRAFISTILSTKKDAKGKTCCEEAKCLRAQ